MSFFDHVVKDGDNGQEGSRESERSSPWCSTSDVHTENALRGSWPDWYRKVGKVSTNMFASLADEDRHFGRATDIPIEVRVVYDPFQ